MKPRFITEEDFQVLLANRDRHRTPAGSSSGERHPKGVKMREPHTKDALRNRSTKGHGNVKSGARTPQPTKEKSVAGKSIFRSKLEAAYANKLEFEKRAGVIHDWWFEPLNLRLPGDKNFYKPDFLVRASDGLTFYEVKGRNKSDDRSLVKIKTAAGLTPWAHFIQVKRINGQWEEREFPCDSPMASVIVEEEV